jgi:hypothetical protein
MIGKLYIDNKDAYTSYGIFVTSGGYNELLAFHSLKNIESNDWPEEDGIEADLSQPALDTKEFRISFASHGKNSVRAFFTLLSDKSYHSFDFRAIGRKYKLRLVSQSNLTVLKEMNVFTLQFANDFPIPENYTYSAPQSNIVPATGYKIDGLDFSQYGTYILKGSKAEVLKSPPVKKNLVLSFNNATGVMYDGEIVFFKTKEVTLNCLMRAGTLSEFWRNYDAMLYNLVRPEERRLSVDYAGREYPCHYKSCKVTKFEPTGKIWFQFALIFVFISFRNGSFPLPTEMYDFNNDFNNDFSSPDNCIGAISDIQLHPIELIFDAAGN